MEIKKGGGSLGLLGSINNSIGINDEVYIEIGHQSSFQSKQVIEMSDLSKQAVINNIQRLVKLGILQKEEYRCKNKVGKFVRYKINVSKLINIFLSD